MPVTSSAADVLGVATLVLVLLLICAGLGCIAYVLYFRRRIQKERLPALQDFNSLWIVRIILIVLAVLWSLVELLRLPLLRQPNWIFHSWSFRAQANVCRFYILSSLGFLEPCFFLTALFLVHGSLRKAPFTPRRAWNGKVVALILICCLPVFLFQLFFVVISPNIEFKKSSGGVYNLENEGYGGKVPYYFTQAFVNVTIDSREVAVCCYPFLSTLVLASFGILYSAYFLLLGWRVVRVVINRYLQRRLYGLLGALLLLLPLHVLFLGLSVLSKPTHVPFELLSFFGFIMVLLCTTVGEGILVIRPIADALAVGWVMYAGSESGRDTDAPGEGLVSLSVFGSDDDEAALVGSRALFAKSQSRNRSRDAEDSESGSARRSFLRPNGSFSDHNGTPFYNPDSPAHPGKPLIPHHHHQKQPYYPFL